MFVFDTREKANDHIKRYFDKHGIPYSIAKVETGDYILEENQTIAIERKKNIAELAHNLVSKDRARFFSEIRRARDSGIRLIILCEQAGVKTAADVTKWVPKYGKVTGKTVAEAIFRLEMAYGVPVLFCDKRSTGRRIVEILTEGAKDDVQT